MVFRNILEIHETKFYSFSLAPFHSFYSTLFILQKLCLFTCISYLEDFKFNILVPFVAVSHARGPGNQVKRNKKSTKLIFANTLTCFENYVTFSETQESFFNK